MDMRAMPPELAPLLDYLDQRFNAINQDMADLKESMSSLQRSVDGFARRADAYLQEMAVPTQRVERHERWLQEIARHLGLRLEL